jgi:hypothetical protein
VADTIQNDGYAFALEPFADAAGVPRVSTVGVHVTPSHDYRTRTRLSENDGE